MINTAINITSNIDTIKKIPIAYSIAIINEQIDITFRCLTFSNVNGLSSLNVLNIFINLYTIISAGIPDAYSIISAAV